MYFSDARNRPVLKGYTQRGVASESPLYFPFFPINPSMLHTA